MAVIILTWNGRDDTLSCIDSLESLTYPNVSIILVDNGSTDGTVAAVGLRWPSLTVIENHTNLGFAGGNNVGIRHAFGNGADYVLVLNNDTIVDPDLLQPLVAQAERDSMIGLLNPKIYYFDEPRTLWSAGMSLMPGRVFGVRVPNCSVMMDGCGSIDNAGQFDDVRDVDAVTGCALFARRDILERIGLFDEGFFIFSEDVDLSLRARAAGYRCVYVPKAVLWHRVSRSPLHAGVPSQENPRIIYLVHRNWLTVIRRHLGWRNYLAVLAAYGLSVLPREWLRLKRSHHLRPQHITSYLLAIFDSLLGRTPLRYMGPRAHDEVS